jgi:hypothetical protein
MELEPEPIDLSVLDPSRDTARWAHAAARVAARAIELRRVRRLVARRGVTALALAAAAAFALWLMVPRREQPAPAPVSREDVLDWAVRDVNSGELLEVGAGDAH